MKWWLIEDGDVEIIRAALLPDDHETIGCTPDQFPWRGGPCKRCKVEHGKKTALHTLDSGLHTTDEVPGDYQ